MLARQIEFWTRFAQRYLPIVVGHIDTSHESYEDESIYSSAMNLYFVRLILVLILFNVLAFGPTDYWYLKDHPQKQLVLSLWRVVFGLALYGCWRWTFQHTPTAYKFHHWTTMGVILFAICCVFIAFYGPLNEPRFYGALFAPFCSSLLITNRSTRIISLITVLGSGFLIIFLISPSHFDSPFIMVFLAYFVLSSGFAAAFGDMYTGKVLRNFRAFLALRHNNESVCHTN